MRHLLAIITILWIVLICISCNTKNPGEPVIIGKEKSTGELEKGYGKWMYTVIIGKVEESFWSDRDYNIGDVLSTPMHQEYYKTNLPEDLDLVVSRNKNKPDTMVVFKDSDILYFSFVNH